MTVTGPAPVSAPTASAPATDAPAASSETPTAPSVADQVAVHVRGLRRTLTGAHEATLVLEPEHLGPVRIRMQVEDGVVALSMAGLQVAATEALRDALPDLRRSLAEAGLTLGSTDVADASAWSSWTGTGTGDGGREARNPNGTGLRLLPDHPREDTPRLAVAPGRPSLSAHAGALDLLA